MPALCTLSSLRGLLHRSDPLITAARTTPCAFEESRLGVAPRDSHGWPPIVAGGAPHVRAFFSRGEPQQPFLARLAYSARLRCDDPAQAQKKKSPISSFGMATLTRFPSAPDSTASAPISAVQATPRSNECRPMAPSDVAVASNSCPLSGVKRKSEHRVVIRRFVGEKFASNDRRPGRLVSSRAPSRGPLG
jgi:hypothetical protein